MERAVLLLGEIDHGKSSLLGRLLVESGRANDLQMRRLEGSSVPNFALVVDALNEERREERTVGLTRLTVHLPERSLCFLDAPGHREFLRSVVTGLSLAETVLLVVAKDAGITDTFMRQCELLRLFPEKRLLLIVTKADLICPTQDRLKEQIEKLVSQKIDAEVNVSSVTGEGFAELESLLRSTSESVPIGAPLEFWVQGVRDGWLYGTPTAGVIQVGGRYGAIEILEGESLRGSGGSVFCGEPCRIRVRGAELKRGSFIGENLDARSHILLRVQAFEDELIQEGARYRVRIGTSATEGRVLSERSSPSERWNRIVELQLGEPVPISSRARFILESHGRAIAVGRGISDSMKSSGGDSIS